MHAAADEQAGSKLLGMAGLRPILGIFGAPHKPSFRMPELPEVEVTRRGIEPQLAGRIISGVAVREARLRWPVPKEVSALPAATVRGITRRGKYLLVDCGDGHLILHLGMSGSLRVLPRGTPRRSTTTSISSSASASCACAIRAASARCSGPGAGSDTHPLLVHLGIEPLSRELHAAAAARAARGRTASAIKQFLMDGRRIVGVGNIYANESLFLAGIQPRTPRAPRSRSSAARSSPRAIKHTLRAAIRAGGSSLRDFVGVDGDAGYFQQRYWVYDRAGEPCRRCGTPIRRILQGQRSTYYCITCQKWPTLLPCAQLLLVPADARTSRRRRRAMAISRTSVAEMNMCCSEGVRKIVSISG